MFIINHHVIIKDVLKRLRLGFAPMRITSAHQPFVVTDVKITRIAKRIANFVEQFEHQRIEPRIRGEIRVGMAGIFGQIKINPLIEQPLAMTER